MSHEAYRSPLLAFKYVTLGFRAVLRGVKEVI